MAVSICAHSGRVIARPTSTAIAVRVLDLTHPPGVESVILLAPIWAARLLLITTGGFMPKRELIAPNGDKRFVRRDQNGRFAESDDVGRSLSQDGKRQAKTATKSGQGDRGDRKR